MEGLLEVGYRQHVLGLCFFFLWSYLFFNVCECFGGLYVCAQHVCLVPEKVRRWHHISGTVVSHCVGARVKFSYLLSHLSSLLGLYLMQVSTAFPCPQHWLTPQTLSRVSLQVALSGIFSWCESCCDTVPMLKTAGKSACGRVLPSSVALHTIASSAETSASFLEICIPMRFY